ncbi:50S ribosomal protein L25/general stress protein Ctc [Sporosarcina sp. HYO08]|uniref:50S ribosomal protein L25/general stress protein Ctc n=1 Tax=Sporosarcina sp. HYO08 TaxID=1759557 RepID=UPI0007947B9E|nr:50S ribosomal protein L25/general stress protein Ctc [Sporosarcina sp. HYO08]KXH86826.1 50S ribosomal protein L25 [Sporosarcina sp. HYO08]
MSTTIQSKVREVSSKSTLTQLRNEGFVPAIVYGYQVDPTPVSVNEGELIKTLRVTGRNGVLKLDIEGKSINVVLNDYQTDAIKGDIRHADFLAINMKDELEVEVVVNLIGESEGEKEGGIVQQPNREITVKVKPSDIPETFDIDISAMQIGDTLMIADIREKSTFEILNEDDFPLVTISAPRSEEDLDGEATTAEVPEEPVGQEA